MEALCPSGTKGGRIEGLLLFLQKSGCLPPPPREQPCREEHRPDHPVRAHPDPVPEGAELGQSGNQIGGEEERQTHPGYKHGGHSHPHDVLHIAGGLQDPRNGEGERVGDELEGEAEPETVPGDLFRLFCVAVHAGDSGHGEQDESHTDPVGDVGQDHHPLHVVPNLVRVSGAYTLADHSEAGGADAAAHH